MILTEQLKVATIQVAPYVHYNYERKDCYNIEIEVGISNSLVVKAEKAPLNTYVL